MNNSGKYQTQNRRAIIDVGSNSVKLLIAEVNDGVVESLAHEGEQARLGRGVFETGKLEQEAIK
ncbi:MAG: exopolyphosphatase, partial [Verrucomicrobiales bacterium]|nr:exopolyphosphatase [Verrucomicrobiales bacterium]